MGSAKFVVRYAAPDRNDFLVRCTAMGTPRVLKFVLMGFRAWFNVAVIDTV